MTQLKTRFFKRSTVLLMVAWTSLLLSGPASAGFHFMQIQQAIGGVGGDTAIQAVQLRMRSAGQNFVNTRAIRAYDAAGENPVDIVVFDANVANNALGSSILVATAEFQALTGLTADFTMANAIPQSYLAAGRLAFQSGSSTYWAIAWGGSAYTGTNTGLSTNDSDGDFSPQFDGPLPSDGSSALLFSGAASDLSVNNAADYVVTAGSATFTNNAGESQVVPEPEAVFQDGFETPAM